MCGKYIMCDRHDARFDEDEGCSYCYEEYKDREKLISEFVEKLRNIEEDILASHEGLCTKIRKEYEARIK